ncbi:MAG: ROK family protein [Chloroflexi bacterium]|nr:ROK family protein [Chloroflexota bacterium]
MSERLIGVDIGGTKCAISLGRVDGNQITILDKRRFPTPATPQATLDLFAEHLEELKGNQAITAIGISCGGPLDSRRGLVLEPPNLPGWMNIPVVEYFEQRFHIPTALQNDANAGALAEWLWGAGRGLDNLIFLTFGTGMGAGLILNGQLYSGTNDMGGEVGHIRLADDGPVGFGKAGSFEGFCSGGGIARLAFAKAEAAIRAGNPPTFAPTLADLPDISTRTVAEAANAGDPLALEIFNTVARRLGQGLALLIDILNPQRIILGSIYLRQRHLLEETMWAVLHEEVIPYSLSVVDIVPPGLGESIGDFAAFAVAHYRQK